MLFLRVLTWFGIVAFAGFTSVKGAAVQYAPIKGPNRRLLPAEITGNTSIYNVLDFGAIANGTGENVIAFQNALNEANKMKGGSVYVPPGQYQFQTATTLNIPKGVTLMGSYGNVPSQSNQVGSVLIVKGGKNDDNGCFIQLNEDSTLSGFYINYPNQKQIQTPVPYPWTVCMSGNNPAVTDLHCLNCWNAVHAVSASRHYLARIQGQPANIGIFIEKTVDYGTVEDVQFHPWYSTDPNFMKWQIKNGRSFVFSGTNWEYVSNTFSSLYAVGYHFIESSSGHFIGIGADQSANASVQVDSSDETGILISNGRFTTYSGNNFGRTVTDPVQVLINETNKGNVQFSNSAFSGPSNHIARISGSGSTSFSQCVFTAWDREKKGYSAITVNANGTGSLLVQGNNFPYDSVGPQVELGDENLSKAIVTGNLISGTTQIVGKAKTTQIGMNADDFKP